MKNPLVSVIIPVYNVEKYLPACLDSICNQTFRELEIIVVDDGSTDRSGCIAEEFAQKDAVSVWYINVMATGSQPAMSVWNW